MLICNMLGNESEYIVSHPARVICPDEESVQVCLEFLLGLLFSLYQYQTDYRENAHQEKELLLAPHQGSPYEPTWLALSPRPVPDLV